MDAGFGFIASLPSRSAGLILSGKAQAQAIADSPPDGQYQGNLSNGARWPKALASHCDGD